MKELAEGMKLLELVNFRLLFLKGGISGSQNLVPVRKSNSGSIRCMGTRKKKSALEIKTVLDKNDTVKFKNESDQKKQN